MIRLTLTTSQDVHVTVQTGVKASQKDLSVDSRCRRGIKASQKTGCATRSSCWPERPPRRTLKMVSGSQDQVDPIHAPARHRLRVGAAIPTR
jgi:hypothetical protein